MQTSEEKTLISVMAYQTAEGWIGIIRKGEDTILDTPPQKTERRALVEIRLAWKKAIYKCQHEWDNWNEANTGGNEWGGAEYIQTCECKKCGLLQIEYSDRSMYDYED